MEIIVPAAGLSTRFPNVKPKYLHYAYDLKMMLVKAVERYKDYNVTVVILKEHVEKYNAFEFVRNELPSARIIVLDEPTSGPAETVYQALTHIGDHDFSFLVKDCDSFFDHEIPESNFVCVSKIEDHKVLRNLNAKSFVKYNEEGIIVDIIEKKVVSDAFCVGAYKINSSKQYINSYKRLSGPKDHRNELFVSHIIQDMLSHGEIFLKEEVSNYVDVGTADDWHEYNDKPVIFCDVDGTLVKAQSRYGSYSYGDPPIVLENNCKVIKEHHDRGCMIVFTSSRPKKYEEKTKQMLNSLGFSNYALLVGLPNSSRILINDYNEANPYPRAIAVNVRRDSDNMKDYM